MANPRGLWRMCLLAAATVAVAGCVGMPSNGPIQQSTASPSSPALGVNLIGPHPSGPMPGATPTQIVEGFLLASASYPNYPVAQDYLISSAIKGWKPGFAVTVFNNLNYVLDSAPATAKPSHPANQQVTVKAVGQVQASFDGTGQYVSLQNQGQAGSAYPFKLVKVDGQWRITNPPNFRMLLAVDFPLFYKAQDLYFVDPQDRILIPDSVFAPSGTTASEVVDNLVNALIGGPATPWLEGAADTEISSETKVLGTIVAGPTVTVNLGDPLSLNSPKIAFFAAQLVWTLTGSLPNIQSVVLEIKGHPWTPDTAPCPGDDNLSSTQTQAVYECFDPYPSSPVSFSYINGGQVWARCGNKAEASQGLIGPVMPLVARPGVLTSQQCNPIGFVHEGSTVLPAAQPQSLPALSMAAVSSDGKYVAVVESGNGTLYFGATAAGTVALLHSPRLTGGGVTALSFDGNDDLWVAQSGAIWMLPPTGKSQVPVPSPGSVSALSVAPDGVRIAIVSQVGDNSPRNLYLAAIGGGQPPEGASGQLGPATAHSTLTLRQFVSLGPNLQSPSSVTWYDADDLVALDAGTLWDVPVDGQSAQELPVTPPGVTSVTAAGGANVLVAALPGNNLQVSTSLEGPWKPLGDPGQSPAYPS